MDKPTLKYLRRNQKLCSLQVKVPLEMKAQVDAAAAQLDTSLNRFTEAAIAYYLEQLKKDGAL